jgi:hypothetical protein
MIGKIKKHIHKQINISIARSKILTLFFVPISGTKKCAKMCDSQNGFAEIWLSVYGIEFLEQMICSLNVYRHFLELKYYCRVKSCLRRFFFTTCT